jgi:hypothetical protein
MLSVTMLSVIMLNVVAPKKVTVSFSHLGRRSLNGSIYVASSKFLSIFIHFNSDGLYLSVRPGLLSFSKTRLIITKNFTKHFLPETEIEVGGGRSSVIAATTFGQTTLRRMTQIVLHCDS